MDLLNEFDVSDEGVLKAYHGPGGDVVIPEGVKFIDLDCVFDNDDAIKYIYLPKGFMGHVYDKALKSRYDLDLRTNKVIYSSLDKWYRPSSRVSKTTGRYCYLRHLDLPKLERYEVDPENPVYSSSNGLLFSKCEQYLLDIPRNFSGEIIINKRFEDKRKSKTVLSANKVRQITFLDQYLYTEDLKAFTCFVDGGFSLYAPNAKSISWHIGDDDLWVERYNHIVSIMPNLKMFETGYSEIGISTVMGFLLHQDMYDENQTNAYIEYLLRYEQAIYNEYALKGFELVKSFYEQIWERKELPKFNLKKDQVVATFLYEAILNGCVDDINRALLAKPKVLSHNIYESSCNVDYCGPHALGLACRYGGVDKLKCLLDDPNLAPDNLTSEGKKIVWQFKMSEYYLWLTSKSCFYDIEMNTSLYFGDSLEIRDLSPLDEDERLEYLKLLVERKILLSGDTWYEDHYLCFVALLSGDMKIANYLLKRGISMSAFIKKCPADKDIDSLVHFALREYAPGVVQLLRDIASDGGLYSMHPNSLKYMLLYRTKEFSEIIEYIDIKTKALVDGFILAVNKGKYDALATLINSNKIKSKQTLDKLMQMSHDMNEPEALALLLEKQKNFKSKRKTSKKTTLTL